MLRQPPHITEALRRWLDGGPEEPELTAWMRERIKESLEDPSPDIPIEEVFDRLLDRVRRVRTKDE